MATVLGTHQHAHGHDCSRSGRVCAPRITAGCGKNASSSSSSLSTQSTQSSRSHTRAQSVRLPVLVAALSIMAALSLSPVMTEPHEVNTLFGHAHAQAGAAPIAGHVVINEADTNPPGSDTTLISEWVELYNPTSSGVDIGGWKIASTTALKKSLTIPPGTIIGPGKHITYTHQHLWLADRNESIELRDATGSVIDATPALTDAHDDTRSWQRVYDGYALAGNSSDWRFGTPTPGSSNGKLQQQSALGQTTITIDTDRDSYTFGQTVAISGTVSEIIFVEKPAFAAEKITLQVSGGTSYQKTFTLYPDRGLGFTTTLDLQQVQGITEGTYTITASYAGAEALASFDVGYLKVEDAPVQERSVTVATDSAEYVPGQEVVITGFTTKTASFATFGFEVTDPSGATIASGNPAPINGAFETAILISSVDPSHGTHTVRVQYAGASSTTTFEVVPKQEGDRRIELKSDRDAYSPGQRVTITGMLNEVWTASLDVRVLQTRQETTVMGSSHSGFKIEIPVRVAGDGSFAYSFEIPNGTKWLGDYKVTVSGDVGSAGIAIPVVENPESFVPSDRPITIHTDKDEYLQNEEITFTGRVMDIASGGSTNYITTRVYITIADADGILVSSSERMSDVKRGFASGDGGAVDYQIVVTPEESGRFAATMDVLPSIFDGGTYTATVSYRGQEASTSFSVFNQYNITEAAISTDKKVYGLGETVTVAGVLPPSGANHASITLTKPDGSTIRSDAAIEGQRFAWEWDAPRADRKHSIKEGQLRGLTLSVFGAYKITATTDTHSAVAYFKLSEDPENDSFEDTPLIITTSKALYEPGDTLVVSGNVVIYDEGVDGLRAPPRVTITVEDKPPLYKDIYESRVYPDNAGAFSAEFALPIGVFSEGTYRVTASYGSERAATAFGMANDYVTSASGPLTLHVETDSHTYNPGQTVTITGGPSKIISVEEYIVSVAKKAEYEADCQTVTCGTHRGPTTSIEPDPTASFTHQFYIPNNTRSVGIYEVTVETHIGTERVTFEVVEYEPEPEPFLPEIIIQRHNRLVGAEFEIAAQAGMIPVQGGGGNATVMAAPVSLVGSVIAPGGQEGAVNLRVMAVDGTCVIGQAEECAITESTRAGGRTLETVQLGDGNSNSSISVIYSGPGERLERFAIYAAAGQDYLPDMKWGVEIVKDDSDTASIFYYKIAYMTTDAGQ